MRVTGPVNGERAVCIPVCVFLVSIPAAIGEVMGIFLCPCLCQVAPVSLALTGYSHGVTPNCKFLYVGSTPGHPLVGSQRTARSGEHESANLIPPAWEDQNLKTSCASQETRPGTGPLGSLCILCPWRNLPDPSSLPFPRSPLTSSRKPALTSYCNTTHRKCYVSHMHLCTCHFPSPPPIPGRTEHGWV